MARGRERDLAGGDLLTGADDAHDLRAHALDGDVEALQHASGEPLLLAKQAEQDVLGPDVVVLERSRLLLRENDHLPGSFCESLEHLLLILPAAALTGRRGVVRTGWGVTGRSNYPTAHIIDRQADKDERSGSFRGHGPV